MIGYTKSGKVVVLYLSIYPCDRLDRQTQATTFIHQVFGGYLRSRGKLFVLNSFLDLYVQCSSCFLLEKLKIIDNYYNKLICLFQSSV